MTIYKHRTVFHSFLLLTFALLFMVSMASRRQLMYDFSNLKILSSSMKGETIKATTCSAHLQGMAAYQQQRYSEAVMWLRLATPNNTLLRWHLAQAQNKNGDWRDALDVLDLQVPIERKLHFNILFEHFQLLSSEERTEWQRRIQYEYPDMILPYAGYLLDIHNYSQARKWSKLSPDFAQSASAQMIVGWSYFYTNSFAEAEVAFRSAYRLSPSGITAFAYGRTLLYESKLREAIPFLEEAVQVESSSSALAWYLSELGVAYARVGRCAEAVTAFEQALEYDPGIENVERVAKAQTTLSGACEIKDMRP